MGCATSIEVDRESLKKSGAGSAHNPKLSSLVKESILSKHPQCNLIVSQLMDHILKKLNQAKIADITFIFRASQHKFKAAAYHEVSSSKKNIIFLACTSKKRYFGAFTPCEIKKDSLYEYEEDTKLASFLFTVEEAQLATYDIKKEQSSHAFMNHSDCGPIFGEGHDIIIHDQAQKAENWCNIGKTYKSKHRYGTVKGNSQLAGQEKFVLDQYEIWELKLI